MTAEAKDFLSLVLGAEFNIRTLAVSYLPIGEQLQVEVESASRARVLIESFAAIATPDPAATASLYAAPKPLELPDLDFAAVDEDDDDAPTVADGQSVDDLVAVLNESDNAPSSDFAAAEAVRTPDVVMNPVEAPDVDVEPVDEPAVEVDDEEEFEDFPEIDVTPLPDDPPPIAEEEDDDDEIDIEMEDEPLLDLESDPFPEDFQSGFGSEQLETQPSAPEEVLAELDLLPEDSMEEVIGDPDSLGDPEETEDLLRENSSDVPGFDEPSEDTPVVEIAEIEVDDPGEDALVTIEDTSDPRSDLDGLSRLDDSDMGDTLDDGDVIIRKDGETSTRERLVDSDLPPEEEETFIADLDDIEKMKARMASDFTEETEDDASSAEVMMPKTPRASVSTSKPGAPSGPRAVAAVAGASAGGVTAGLYGNPNVPQIRDRKSSAPRAAAVQIDAALEAANAQGGSNPLLEEDSILALGSVEDYGEEEVEGADGFSVEMQEYDEIEEEEEEDDVDLEELEPDDIALEPVEAAPEPGEVKGVMQQAVDAVEQGDLDDAIDLYSDVLDMDPDNLDAYVSRGRLHLDYGDYSRAMSDFTRAVDLAPSNPEPRIAIGDLFFARKDYNLAIEHFNHALTVDKDHPMAHCRRGISHYYRKHYADALTDLNRAKQLDPDIPNIQTYIAMAKKKASR